MFRNVLDLKRDTSSDLIFLTKVTIWHPADVQRPERRPKFESICVY
jgi:hypothetical protein